MTAVAAGSSRELVRDHAAEPDHDQNEGQAHGEHGCEGEDEGPRDLVELAAFLVDREEASDAATQAERSYRLTERGDG